MTTPLPVPQQPQNPVLAEIDAAHANLSDPAKAAIEHAHGAITAPKPYAPAGMAGLPDPNDTQHLLPAGMSSRADPGAGAPPTIAPPTQSAVPSLQDPQAAHKSELSRLQSTGSGISQIHNPFLRTIAHIGEGVGSLFPGLTQAIPGTQLHHNQLVNEAQGAVNSDQEENKGAADVRYKNAQTAEQESLPEFHDAQNDIKRLTAENAQNKTEGTDALNHQKADDALREHGYKRDPKSGEVVPLDYSEMSDTQQAVHDLKASQGELADANKAYKEAQTKNLPVAMQMAQQRIQTAQQNANTAVGRLSNAQQNTTLHRDQFNAGYLGQAPGGETLPGAPTDPEGKVIGPKVFSSNKPTGATRTAGERAETVDDLEKRIRAGIEDPEIRRYLGAGMGRIAEFGGKVGVLPQKVAQFRNDLKSYGAFQAGYHPVKGIGAMNYFDQVMGGMGQTPEELLGKLDSNRATSQSVRHAAGLGALPGGTTAPKAGASADVTKDPKFKAYADKYFDGDIKKAQEYTAAHK